MNNINFIHFLLLSLLLVGAFSSAEANDICKDPELISITKKIYDADDDPSKKLPHNIAINQRKGFRCRAEHILYRSPKGIQPAELAKVGYKSKWDYDAITTASIYFLRHPNGELVSLGKFLPAMGLSSTIFSQLGYKLGSGGGQIRTDHSFFYDRLIEKNSEQYCIAYKMKYPFTGELKRCGDNREIQGEIGHAPGVVSITEARQKICKLVADELSMECAINKVEIRHHAVLSTPAGSLYYLLVSRSPIRKNSDLQFTKKAPGGWARCTGTAEYDVRTYRMNAIDGETTLVESTPSSFCGTHSCQGEADWDKEKIKPFMADILPPTIKAKDEQFKKLIGEECQKFMVDNKIIDGESLCAVFSGKHGNTYSRYVSKIDADGDGRMDYSFFWGAGYGIAFLNDEIPFLMQSPKICSPARWWPQNATIDEIRIREQQCVAEKKAQKLDWQRKEKEESKASQK